MNRTKEKFYCIHCNEVLEGIDEYSDHKWKVHHRY